MQTRRWPFVPHNAAPFFGLILALCLTPPALAQPSRYLNLTWVDRSGEVLETIGAPSEYRGLDVSPDGRRVAAHAHVGSGGDVWVFAQDGEGTRLVADATGVQDNAHPIFSPDGARVVYSSLRNGVSGLYVRAVDGSGDEQLVHSSGRAMVPMSWSPDGRFIVFWDNTGFEWVLPLEGDRTPVRLMGDQSSHSQISPDGKWVAYAAGNNVWVRGFPDGAKAVQVSAEAGFFPRWRGDGRELYYASAVSLGMVMAAAVTATADAIEVSKPQPLFDTEYINFGHQSNYHTFAVSPDGERFLIPRPEPDTLVAMNREGVSRTLDTDGWSAPRVSPDGSRVAAIRRQRSVWVVDMAGGDRRQIGALDGPRIFALSLEWSRDGERVAYVALDLASGKDVLYLANADGAGEPQLLRTLPGVVGQLLGFTPDGESLLYFSSQLGGDVLLRIPLDGAAEPVELARGTTGMLGPSLSPDGRHLAYRTNALNTNEVWVRPLNSETGELGTPTRVGGGLGMTAWRADGGEIYYVGPDREFMVASVRASPTLAIGEPRRLFDLPDAIPVAANFDGLGDVSADGSAVVLAVPPRIPTPAQVEMRVVDRAGTVVATPGEPGEFFGRPMISPDGTKVAAGITRPLEDVFELWVFDLEADTARRLMSDRNLNSWIWSEDGTELIYVSMDFNSDEGGGIFRRAADGSGSAELLYRHYPGTGFNLIDWSADGRFVLFNSGGVLCVLPLDRQHEPVELIRDEFSVAQGLLSQDSRFVAFTSDETRPMNAWLWSFDPDAIALGPASEKVQLSKDGAGGPLSWGRDGREVTYRNAGAMVSVVMSTSGGLSAEPPRELFRHPEGAGAASASRNGERWVFFAPALN